MFNFPEMDSYLPITAVVLLIICLLFKWQYSYWSRKSVEVLPPLPIFGNIFESFFMQRHITDVIEEIYCKFPRFQYIGFYEFHRPGLILKDVQLIRRVLCGDLCVNYQNNEKTNDNVYLLFKERFFLAKFNDSEMLQCTIKSYFDEERFKKHFVGLRTSCQNLIEYIEGSPEFTIEEGFEAKELSSKFTLEAVLKCGLNIDGKCFTHPQSEFLELYEKHFRGTSVGGLFKLLSNNVERKAEASLKSNFATSEGTDDSIYSIFGAHNKNNLIECLVSLCNVFESSTTLLAYCLYELALNGDMQKKIRNEIRELKSEANTLSPEDIVEKLQFLNNVLFETLRMHSHIFMLKKKCIKGHNFPSQNPGSPDIFVEKGCEVFIPIYSMHMDEKNYTKPFCFNPNRYSNSENILYPYPGFEHGSEYCLGFKYGFLLTKLAITIILSQFQVVLTSKNTGVLTFSKKTPYLSSEEGIWITFSKVS